MLVVGGVTLALGGLLLTAKLCGWLDKAPAVSEVSAAESSEEVQQPLVTHPENVTASIKKVSVTFGENAYDLIPNEDGALIAAEYPDLPRNGGAIDDLLSAYSSITPTKAVFESPTEEDIEACGLNAPSLVITLAYNDGTSHTLSLGRSALGDQPGYYGRLDKEETIWLFDTSYYLAAAADPLDYVAKTLIVAPSANADDKVGVPKLKTILLSGADRKEPVQLRYVTSTDDKSIQMCSKYVLEKPYFHAVDNTAVDGWDTSLTGLYANTIEVVHPTAKQLADFGLSDPHSKASLTFGIYKATDEAGEALDNPEWYNEVTYTLALGNRTEDNASYYAMLDGVDVVYTVSVAVVPWSETQYETLVNKSLFLRYITDVSGVRVTVNDSAYTLSLKHGTKKEEDGTEKATLTATLNKKTVEESEARSMYETIMSVKRVAAAPDDAKADGTPALSIELIPLKGDPDATFSFYPYSATRYLCVCDNGERFLVKSTDVEGLASQWTSAAKTEATKSTAKKTNS